jgi:hypothetical protein
VCAWHQSYRNQLAEEREENCRLREQIWRMQEHACNAQKMIRDFVAKLDSSPREHDRNVERIAMRQELRFWKRMAMPEVPDDDPMWSDDDDLVDPAEKPRLDYMEKRSISVDKQLTMAVRAGAMAVGEEDAEAQQHHSSGRPVSAGASSTGSTG